MKILVLLISTLCLSNISFGAVIYVDVDAIGANDGSSWTNAYNEVYDALANSNANDDIWIAEGWYLTDGINVMFASHGLKIYGGFEGTETILEQRNWNQNVTTISANVGNIFLATDNAPGIFKFELEFTNDPIFLDGITLRDIYNETEVDIPGIRVFTPVNNPTATTITNCKFVSNNPSVNSPLISTVHGELKIENCLFFLNQLQFELPGTLIFGASNVEINQCTFYQNNGYNLIHANEELTVLNSIEFDNENWHHTISGNGNEITIYNSIIHDIFIFDETLPDTQNLLHVNPGFIDPDQYDFNLAACSEAIEAGIFAPTTTYDLAGNPRLINSNVDLGCYEFQSILDIIYVDRTASGANDGSSWNDAYLHIQDAIDAAPECSEIWVKAGFYVPASKIEIDKSLKIFGGFDGTENDRVDRDWSQNLSRISGDIGVFGDPLDNLTCVVQITDETPIEVIFDGFVIEDTYNISASSTSPPFSVSALDIASTVKIKHCTFRDNVGFISAALYVDGGTVEVINSQFYDNFSTAGAACIYTGSSVNDTKLSVFGCTFSRNESSYSSSEGSRVIYVFEGDFVMTNSIIWDNVIDWSVSSHAGIFNQREILHNIISPSFGTYSINKDNLDIDPEFIDSPAFDFSLQPCSPAVEAGNNNYSRGQRALNGSDRISGVHIDIGCFEYEQSNLKLYVNQAATGANNGSTWSNAYTDLQNAISNAQSGDQIWVATGTFLPTPLADPTVSFEPNCGVSLYGGFAGFEFLKSDRDIASNPTILSGDISGATNSYHIIDMSSYKSIAEIDGFTIANGDAQGSIVPVGGGMFLNNFEGKVENCIFENNHADKGGGIYIQNSFGGEIKNCTFNSNNAPVTGGGGIATAVCDLNIQNCLFKSNTGSDGGALHLIDGEITLINLLFDNNESTQEGGAIYGSNNVDISMEWCTVNENFSPTGGGAVHINGSTSHFKTVNSIYSKNRTLPFTIHHFDGNIDSIQVTNCIVQGGWANGIDIINEDPLFKDEATCNFIPTVCSPAIDAAVTTTLIPVLDIRGASRTIGNGSDLGAFEQKFPYYFSGIAGPDKNSCSGDSKTITFPLPQKDTAITVLTGGELKSGIMFDIVPKETLTLTRFHGHWIEGNAALLTRVYVYWRQGSSYEGGVDQSKWAYVNALAGIVNNSVSGELSYMLVDYINLELEAGKTYGFYIYLDEEGGVDSEYIRTSTPPSSGFGDLQEELDHLSIYYGRSVGTSAWGSMSPFAAAFEGGITYELYDSLQWSNGTQIIGTEQSVTVSPIITTDYYVTLYDINGCSYTDTIAINVNGLPLNDNCANATPLIINSQFIDGTTRCASITNQSIGSCAPGGSPTVWYSVVGPESTKLRVKVKNIVPYTNGMNVKILAFEGACGSLTEIGCIDDFGVNEDEEIILSGLNEGEVYYLAIRAANSQQGDFEIRAKDICEDDFVDEVELPTDTILCDQNSLTLSTGIDIAEIAAVEWFRNGNLFTTVEPFDVDFSDLGGDYSYRVQLNNGCISKDTINIKFQNNIVSIPDDQGINSVRAVIGCLETNDTMYFSPLLDGDTIKLTGPQINLNLNNNKLIGRGVTNTIISAENNHRIFANHPGSSLTIRDMSLVNGAFNAGSGGGAIRNDGTLILRNIFLKNNIHALQGGAILNQGDLFLQNVFFDENNTFGSAKHMLNKGNIIITGNVVLEE